MLYYLFNYLGQLGFPGARLMDYITFRSGAALVLSLFIAIVFGRRIIDRLQLMQVGEIIRDLGLEGQMKKTGTPTMGGVIIIISILIPCLLVGNLSNVYMLLMLVATLWLGTLGFLDDYIKVARRDKDGLKGKFKIVGQVGLGLIVGLTMVFSPSITMRENVEIENIENHEITVEYKAGKHQVAADHHTFCKEQQLQLCLFHAVDGQICRDRRMDTLRACDHIRGHRQPPTAQISPTDLTDSRRAPRR